jgi:hypothetical protein
MESTPLSENRRAVPWHWIVLGLLVVVHAGLGAYFYSLVASHLSHSLESILMGFILSQPILFAFWSAFAPQRFHHRFLWSLLLCIMVAFAVDCGGSRNELGILMLVDIIYFIIATPVFLLFRRYSGWHIIMSHIETISSDYRAYQFGIKHLIVFVTITAFGLGLIRTLLLMSSSPFLLNNQLVVIITTLFALSIPVIMLAWLIMANRWISFVQLLICLGVFDFGIHLLSQSYTFRFSDIRETLFIQLGAALSVILTTLVMRWCGFRMIRVRKTAASAGEP